MATRGAKTSGLIVLALSASKDPETTPERPYPSAIIATTKTGLTMKLLPNAPKNMMTVPASERRKAPGYAGLTLLKHAP